MPTPIHYSILVSSSACVIALTILSGCVGSPSPVAEESSARQSTQATGDSEQTTREQAELKADFAEAMALEGDASAPEVEPTDAGAVLTDAGPEVEPTDAVAPLTDGGASPAARDLVGYIASRAPSESCISEDTSWLTKGLYFGRCSWMLERLASRWGYDQNNGTISLRDQHKYCFEAVGANQVRLQKCVAKSVTQKWDYDATTGTIKASNGLCLSPGKRSLARYGALALDLETCDGSVRQQWRFNTASRF